LVPSDKSAAFDHEADVQVTGPLDPFCPTPAVRATLNGQISRLLALEDAFGVNPGFPVSTPLRFRRKRGKRNQAIGRSRGGRTTKSTR